MTRTSRTAALLGAGCVVAATLTGVGAASAAPAASGTVTQSCTMRLPAGTGHVYATWHIASDGRRASGSVAIVAPSGGPARIIVDRVNGRRGKGGTLSPGATLAWGVRNVPMGAHASVAMQDTSGKIQHCTTR